MCSSCSWIRTILEESVFFLVKSCMLNARTSTLCLSKTGHSENPSGTQKLRCTAMQERWQNCSLSQLVAKDHFCTAGAHAQAALGDCEWKLQRSVNKQSVEIWNDNVQLTLVGTHFLKKHHSSKISPRGHLEFLRGCSGHLCAAPRSCCPCYRWLQMCAQTLQLHIVHPTTVSGKTAGWQLFLTSKQQVMNGHKQNEILKEKSG